ncbi:GntR family transcriptional regulator [Devosia sp.]|uniref:GntR family transcriptional regulator n=1 Tax=Devosia sp. TaxID=1871048 RepID=UPI002F15B568
MFDGIVERIVSGSLRPGAKLNEPELARDFGVSRGPLREAIGRLEERQLVRCTPNAGARVIEHSPEEILQAFELREALEGMAAGLAAERMTETELAELRSIYEEEIESQKSNSWSRNFHLCIVRGSRNAQIGRILNEDFYRLLKLWRQTSSWLCHGTDLTWNEHRRILDAIENRDGECAEMLMRRHINRLRLTSIRNLAALEKPETA